MKLSRTVAYAVQAALQLAQTQSAQPVPCSQLAAEGRMPERFLLQIMRSLVLNGILQSTRGVEGGYVLCRKPTDISLWDIIEAIEGPQAIDLPEETSLPPAQAARLREVLGKVSAVNRQQLEAIRLSDLMTPANHNAQSARGAG